MATTTTGNLISGGADALAAYLAAQAKAQKDEADKAFQQQNTEAGFYVGTRAEDLTREKTANDMAQQSPFTQFDSLQKENQKMDLASGQDVGPKFRSASVIPGLEKYGAIPQLSFNYGSNFKAAQTPSNLANEYANSQIRQAQVNPNSPVSNLEGLFGGEIGSNLDTKVSAAATQAKNAQELSKSNQLAAIKAAVTAGTGGGSGGSLGGALGAAALGALGSGSGAGGDLGVIGNAVKALYNKLTGKNNYTPSTLETENGFYGPVESYGSGENLNPSAESLGLTPEQYTLFMQAMNEGNVPNGEFVGPVQQTTEMTPEEAQALLNSLYPDQTDYAFDPNYGLW